MLCFNDEKQKDTTYSKTRASHNILGINAIVLLYSSFVLFCFLRHFICCDISHIN